MSPMMGQNIFGGILLSFIFFILINKISVYFGLNSPLLPILITTLIIGISLKRKIVDEVFPLIGIGFYLLIGWMILYTDMLYGTYAEEYGWVLLFVSVMAFVIWIVYFITIKILQKLLNQAKQRIGEIVVHLFVIGGIIYNIYRLYRLKKNLLFGLTGGAAISVHLFLHIHNIEYLPLELTTFMIASFVALLPFYTRNIQKNHKRSEKWLMSGLVFVPSSKDYQNYLGPGKGYLFRASLYLKSIRSGDYEIYRGPHFKNSHPPNLGRGRLFLTSLSPKLI